jgi:AAA family ATP:ADP antiporter
MASVLDKSTLFYATCIPFFVFFVIFDVAIYPNKGKIQPDLTSVTAFLGASTSSGGRATLANIIANWTSALFYVVSEIYSSVSVGILFWQYANDVVSVDQAKRFYPLFAQMSGLAPILAGQYSVRYASKAADFGQSLHRLTFATTFAGVMICVFYHLSSNNIEMERLRTISHASPMSSTVKPKKTKPKLSMIESFKFLSSSQYLRLLGMLVLGYGLSINFTDIMWKSLMKKKYPDPLDYQRFMGNFSSVVGASTCVVIFFGVHVIRVLGWRVGALATPGIMALLAIPFFGCILVGLDSPSRLNLAVTFGTIQTLLSKTSKYALFDPTTQMAYIPLDQESKVKGKAAIDVLGSRLGKSGGSIAQQGLIFLFGNILNAAPAVAVVFYFVLFCWLTSANQLNGLFIAKTELKKAEENKL